MGYQLGIDLGTTYTAAAVHRHGRVQILELGNRTAAIPSVIFLKEDETILTGEAAERRALTEGHRVARQFKRRLGDPTPILLGGSPYSAESLMAKVLRWVVDAVAEREGGPPDDVTVSHPANWGPYKKDLLDQAVRLADLGEVTTISEPEAAATFYASQERVEPGSVIAVYDLGGGTFDAALLRKTDDGFAILGEPEGIERLGGIDFDEAVFAHVAQALGGALDELDADDPSAVAAVARLREECVAAKEALSNDTDAAIAVMLPNIQTEVRLTRAEFEAMIRPSLADSIASLHRAIRNAGLQPDDIHRVLLVGGSSRIPLVAQMVGAELQRPVVADAHPKHSIAQGAALLAAGAALAGGSAEEPPVVVEASTETPGAAAEPGPPPPAPATGDDDRVVARDLTPPIAAPATRSRGVLIVAGLVVIAVVVGALFALGGGGDDGDDAAAEEATSTTTTQASATTTATSSTTAEVTTTTSAAPTTTTLFPPDTRTVRLTDIAVDGANYVVGYETDNYEPVISDDPASFHIHFFWDIYPATTVGVNAPVENQNPWVVWDTDTEGRYRFDGLGPADVPQGAAGICAVVATHEHAVDEPELAELTASCVDLV